MTMVRMVQAACDRSRAGRAGARSTNCKRWPASPGARTGRHRAAAQSRSRKLAPARLQARRPAGAHPAAIRTGTALPAPQVDQLQALASPHQAPGRGRCIRTQVRAGKGGFGGFWRGARGRLPDSWRGGRCRDQAALVSAHAAAIRYRAPLPAQGQAAGRWPAAPGAPAENILAPHAYVFWNYHSGRSLGRQGVARTTSGISVDGRLGRFGGLHSTWRGQCS